LVVKELVVRKIMTGAARQERWDTCQVYIRLAGTLEGAQKLAKADGYSFGYLVWVNAMSKMLDIKE
jgi:hypothetical protein